MKNRIIFLLVPFLLSACADNTVSNIYSTNDFELFEGCFIDEFALTVRVNNGVIKTINGIALSGKYASLNFDYEIPVSKSPLEKSYLDKDYFLILNNDIDDLYFELLFTCQTIDNNLEISYLEFDSHYFFQGNESKWQLPSLLTFKETIVYD